MSFMSFEFWVLLLATFVVYHLFANIRAQNVIILIASYVFYAWWDWRFLFLLLGISLANYATALIIATARSSRTRNGALVFAIVVAIGSLGFFKYYDFFVVSLVQMAAVLGARLDAATLNIILPLGISFMTFQGMAYVIDVWRGDHEAESDLVKFLAFKVFFPQLVAGPIERAGHLLVQFGQRRTLDADKVRRAAWLLALGYLMKAYCADSLAPIVDSQFFARQTFGWSVVLGTIAFGAQIYADFCGYSLIAKGAALLFGIELMWNFRYPYWAVSISDFWRRWHVSLSNWLRDYLYIPLGGSRHGTPRTACNLMTTMVLGGLWHGASWNFVLWGALHGGALALWRFLPVSQVPTSRVGRIVGWAVTMAVVFVGWFLFRATSYDLLVGMVLALRNWEWAPVHTAIVIAILAATAPIVMIERLQRAGADDYRILSLHPLLLYAVLGGITFLCLAMARQHEQSFIYFQF